MFCKQCGKENGVESKFCYSCGVVMKSEDNSAIQTKDEDVNNQVFNDQEDVLITLARGKASGIIVQGIIWFVIGLIITWITYSFAEGGGTYFVLWGAMLVGGIQIIKGIYYWIFPNQLLKSVLEDKDTEIKEK